MYYNSKGEHCGLIYNIQGYTIHDGPGIRTELFFKGCPISCPWCSNPEGMNTGPELGVYPSKCLGKTVCGSCAEVCPLGGKPLSFDENGIIMKADTFSECADCLRCAEECPGEGIIVWGKKMTVPEIMALLERDRSFYERSGGGVTLSGGEVLMQWDFAAELLAECKRTNIHTCVESALFVPASHLEAVLPYIDLFITDIKFMDSARHKEITGVPNELILENILRVAEAGVPMVIRTPVIPGWNDDEDNILSIGKFLKEKLGSSLVQYQLLPYRKMGTEKYATLGRDYPMGDYEAPEREVWEKNILAIKERLRECFDLPVAAGSGEKLPCFEK